MNFLNRGGGFFNNLPRVTRILLILNIAAFVISYLMKSYNLNQLLGLHNIMPGMYSSPPDRMADPRLFAPVQVITHMFLHGGLGHIFFNMFGLVMFGKVLETVLGEKKFFILYFASGLGAAVLQLGINYYFSAQMATELMAFYQQPDPDTFFNLMREMDYSKANIAYQQTINALIEAWQDNPDSPVLISQAQIRADEIFIARLSVPMVGASGALMGILAAFALFFPNVELMLMFIPVPIKAKYFIPLFVLASLFLGVSQVALTNVAHFAHLGGAIFGFVIAWTWKRKQFNMM